MASRFQTRDTQSLNQVYTRYKQAQELQLAQVCRAGLAVKAACAHYLTSAKTCSSKNSPRLKIALRNTTSFTKPAFSSTRIDARLVW